MLVSPVPMRARLVAFFRSLLGLIACCGAATGASAQSVVTLSTTAAGDATYAWNSKYGPSGYGAGENTIGVGLQMNAPYGNDYTIAIFMVPLANLAGRPLLSATLHVNSTGFGTSYFYGSANMGWVNPGAATLTGDVVTDGLGPVAASPAAGWTFFTTDAGGSDPLAGTAGPREFTVTSYIQADLDAGRAFSIFTLNGSRDTYGGIYAAESGQGAYVSATVVPEPSTYAALAGALALGVAVWRRRAVA
jgi:hypothetical protein